MGAGRAGRGRQAQDAPPTCGQLLRRYGVLAGLTQEELAGRPGAAWKNGRMRDNGSSGSIPSIGSSGSILSIGSSGSILSIGSAGSVASMLSVGSAASLGSVLSALSRWSVLAWRGNQQAGSRPD